jgi:3-keto-5-aminohexanoate cleavage enzyme
MEPPKIMIEAALNEIVRREQNPVVPLTPEEIARDAVECVEAGASIIHFHPRNPRDGSNLPDDLAFYQEAISLIYEKCHPIIYPTYSGRVTIDSGWATLKALVEDGRSQVEYFQFFVGCVGYGRWDDERGDFVDDYPGTMLLSETKDLLTYCRDAGVRVQVGVKEPGNIRQVLLFRQLGLLPDPLGITILLSDDVLTGPPPSAEGLTYLLSLLPRDVEVHWMVQNYGRSHWMLNTLAVAMGGHARTGIGDTKERHRREGTVESSAAMVKRIADMASSVGRPVATVEEARTMIGLPAL